MHSAKIDRHQQTEESTGCWSGHAACAKRSVLHADWRDQKRRGPNS